MNKNLLAAVVAVFATYPDSNAVYVCEDGNVFLEERKNLAENHCRESRFGAPMLVTREDVAKVEVVKDIVQAVNEAVNDAAEEQARKDAEAVAEEKARKEAETANEEQARKDAEAAAAKEGAKAAKKAAGNK